jgi:hypothetical protein
MANPSDEAMKSRILTHMNADHSASLRLYSQHYSKLPLSHAKTSQLTDITPSHLIITSTFGRTLIPFQPPLKSFTEARTRLVAMHEECVRELDVEGVMVESYVLPNRAWMWGMHLFCWWNYITLSPPVRHLILEPGNLVNAVWSLNGTVPGLAKLAYDLSTLTLGIMIAAHGYEAYKMSERLRRVEVEMFGSVWWGWVLDVLSAGFGAFVRLNAVVEGLKGKVEKPEGRPKAEGLKGGTGQAGGAGH